MRIEDYSIYDLKEEVWKTHKMSTDADQPAQAYQGIQPSFNLVELGLLHISPICVQHCVPLFTFLYLPAADISGCQYLAKQTFN